MRLIQKLAIVATGVGGAAIGSLGLGVAHATPATTAPTPAAVTQAPEGPSATTAETPEGHASGAVADAPGGPDVQSGSNVQSGPDTGGVDVGGNK